MRKLVKTKKISRSENSDIGESSTGETRQRLMHAARKLFASEGYDRTSLRDISDEAGANAAAVYYHFRTKEALFTQLIVDFCSRDLENFSRILKPAQSAAEVRVRLEIFFDGLVTFHLENADLLRAITKAPLHLLTTIQTQFASHMKQIHKISLDFLSDAQGNGFLRAELNLKLVNHMFVSTILHPVHAPHQASELFPELNFKKEAARRDYIHSFIDLTLHGILKP